MKNYYDILKISETALPSEIKKQYRKLAKEYHPDRNQGNKAAAEKFKEISEAYEVLFDDEKRKIYDMQRKGGFNPFGAFSDLFGGYNPFEGLGGFESAQSRHSHVYERPKPKKEWTMNVPLSMGDIKSGFKQKKIRLRLTKDCLPCNGKGGEISKRCPHCDGLGRSIKTQKTGNMLIQQSVVCTLCHGRGNIISGICSACKGDGKVQIIETYTINMEIKKDDSGL